MNGVVQLSGLLLCDSKGGCMTQELCWLDALLPLGFNRVTSLHVRGQLQPLTLSRFPAPILHTLSVTLLLCYGYLLYMSCR